MLAPREIGVHYCNAGKEKVNMTATKTLLLGIMAGIFIALAAVGANTSAAMVDNPGLAKLISALVFPAGLAMVVLAGSELFTGECLMVISLQEKKITWRQLLKCWSIVYAGNFIGAVLVAFFMNYCQQLSLFSGSLAIFTIKTAIVKTGLLPEQALVLGIFCNFLVCIAVWISFAGSNVTEKLAGLYLPIFLFVVAGFEHSVANMYYIPAGLFAKTNSAYLEIALQHGLDLSSLTWTNFILYNLVPVTIGNIIGGTGMVGCIYWYIYVNKQSLKGERKHHGEHSRKEGIVEAFSKESQ